MLKVERGWGSDGGRRGKEEKILEGGGRLERSRKVGEGREAGKMLEGGGRGWRRGGPVQVDRM